MKSALHVEKIDNNIAGFFHTAHRRTSLTQDTNTRTTSLICLETQVFRSFLTTLWRVVPNGAALMEPGSKFLLILDNAPLHASRLAFEH